MKKFLTLLTTAALAITFVSCNDKPDPNIDPPTIPVTSVTLNQDTATLSIGDTLQLTATVLPDNATNKTVTWLSTNTNVATVDGGVVVAVAQGTATIIVTTQDGNKTATCEVIVNPPAPVVPVSGVTLNKNADTLALGETLTLIATVLPENATNKYVIWLSHNTDVVTVLDGVVTAVSAGTARIIAVTECGIHYATCIVTVIFAVGCNQDTPGWGASLGTVTRGTRVWAISGNGITQIWSDAVTATNCNKTTYAGGSTGNFNADCRSNASYPGDLFSWCAVIRFQDQLCPAPWRVPTMQDFIDLDLALGGNGQNRGGTPQFVTDNYITRWGGAFGGYCNSVGTLWTQGSWGFYWSQSGFNATHGRNLRFGTGGGIYPQDWRLKNLGFTLRCVR